MPRLSREATNTTVGLTRRGFKSTIYRIAAGHVKLYPPPTRYWNIQSLRAIPAVHCLIVGTTMHNKNPRPNLTFHKFTLHHCICINLFLKTGLNTSRKTFEQMICCRYYTRFSALFSIFKYHFPPLLQWKSVYWYWIVSEMSVFYFFLNFSTFKQDWVPITKEVFELTI